MNYLSIDVGTTACKCQLFSETGDILAYLFCEYDFRHADGFHYVDVHAIEANLRSMIAEISGQFKIDSISVSSLGEAFVVLDEQDNVIFYPMLYTDPRGEDEAREICERIGAEQAFHITGVVPHSMYSLSKLLWIKKHHPEVYARTSKVLLICDYIGYLLTGKRMIDHALASRTGVFDVERLQFSDLMLDAFDIPKSWFSTPVKAGSIVGNVKKEWGVEAVLVMGSHDQVCAALGAGLLRAGDAVDGLGTVECITALFAQKPESVEMGKQGYPCLPYPVGGLYCTYIVNYSCGSTVNWLRKSIMHGYKGDQADFFTYIEKDMADGPTGILMLPYLGGANTPYQDLNAKGAFLNLTTDTRDCDLYKSVMEGTAFEMRLNACNIRAYGITVGHTVATGGGANSAKWMQIKADIQNIPIRTLRSSEGGLCGCAMLQAVAMGSAADLYGAADVFVRYEREFVPDAAMHAAYEPYYEKYQKIYPMIKELQ